MKRNEFTPLFCDFYHLTMAQAMFNDNTHNRTETYEMFIRKSPFEGSYLATAGLGEVLKWLDGWKFDDNQIEYLKKQNMFSDDFLDMLHNSKLEINMSAFREGEIVFPNEPIVSVTGPAWQAVMVEAGILNIINSQSLIATKASRICQAAKCDGQKRNVLELGLRRSQDAQGFSPTRASYIGGIDLTSNVEAAMYYDIPCGGTMAHCFVMREEAEIEAFKKYITSFPNNASVLIDTYNTIEGAKNAIKASKETGVKLQSVRLDSGDLAYLSKEVRIILDNACCNDTKIVASNDLDEKTIQSLILEQGAKIDVFGVGTMLVTSYDQPALGGVYKLKTTGDIDKMKHSEQAIKSTIPGATEVVRIIDENGKYIGDVIHKHGQNLLENNQLIKDISSVNLATEVSKLFKKGTSAYCPLRPVITNGRVNYNEMNRPLIDIKESLYNNLKNLDKSHLRLEKPHIYVAGLEENLYNQRQMMRLNNLTKGI